jgi:hypothetical protein
MDVIEELLNNATKDYILHIINSTAPLDYYIPLISHTFSSLWVFIGKKTYRNNKLHSFDDKPALIFADGDMYWCKHDKLHRNHDRPAVIYRDGRREWYNYGTKSRPRESHSLWYPYN